MTGPKPLFPLKTGPKLPLPPRRQEGIPKGVPPSPSSSAVPTSKSHGNGMIFWVKLEEKSLPQDVEAPILIFSPNVGIEYSVTRSMDLRQAFFAKRKGEKWAEFYRYVTHWAYFPKPGEVTF